ncbi:MAG TPA: glycosyltransferase family 39 protein [Flavipsychrobacter sp.]|nr:glycosyltransferase family 39 protein [Flavipsychrobacter sp.]
MPKIPFWIFIVIAVLYFTGIRVDMMEVDATQYAEISREMSESGNYLQVYQYGDDYLDKPPFLFWISAASISLFGVNNFGYKFPSILFAIWALYATYRLARLLYNEEIARWAALVLGVCQGMFLMTNDVRTDTVLMSWVITAIWAIKECEIKRRWQFVLLGTVSIACGMMSKGPIALLVPIFAMGSDWVLKRKWKNIFDRHHIIDVIIIAALLLPMSIGLYQQFDLHPEKEVNGITGVSGLRFFYWSQSFGRITGESPWNNGAKLDFLIGNMLWSFLPWMLFFVPPMLINVYQLAKQKFRLNEQQEFVTTGGFLLSYLALGSSKYQLPHYIFVAFPLAAIVVSAFLYDIIVHKKYRKLFKILYPLQVFMLTGFLVAAFLLLTIVFPGNVSGLVFCATGTLIWLYLVVKKGLHAKVLWISVCCMLVINGVLIGHFYPELMKYQMSPTMGRYIKEQKLPVNKIGEYKMDRRLHALHYYADGYVKMEDTIEHLADCQYLLTDEKGRHELDSMGYQYKMIKTGEMYNVSMVTIPFLNPNKREGLLKEYYFMEIKK